MTRKEIAEQLSMTTSLSRSQAHEATDAIVNILADALKAKKPVYLRTLGTFCIERRKAKRVRNITARTSFIMFEHDIIKFRPSPSISEAVR